MNIFIDTYNRVYSVRKWTFEHLYCLFVYFIIFALPFYFSFASKNFWFDEQYALLETRYYYTGYYAIQVNSINGATQQLAVLPSSTMDALRKVKLTADESTTGSNFVVELTDFASEIVGVNIILYYDVQVQSLKRVVSAGYAISVPGNLQSGTVTGMISLQPSSPFNALTTASTTTINRPAYFDINYRSAGSFSDLMDAHLDNPYRLETQPLLQTTSDPTTPSPTTRTLTINLLKDTQLVLPYYPPILETLKFKFSTYFGMLMLSYLIFRGLLLGLIKDQALECHERDEVPKGVRIGNYQ